MIKIENLRGIGKIIKSFGNAGEVIISSNEDFEKYLNEPVFLLLEGAPVPFFISNDGIKNRNNDRYAVKFDYIDDEISAKKIVDAQILISKDLLDNEKDGMNIYDLIGYKVMNCDELGEVIDVYDYSGNIVLNISIRDKEILLPLSDEYILSIENEQTLLKVDIPDELIDLN